MHCVTLSCTFAINAQFFLAFILWSMEILQLNFNHRQQSTQQSQNEQKKNEKKSERSVYTIDPLAGGSSICIDLFSKNIHCASKQDYIYYDYYCYVCWRFWLKFIWIHLIVCTHTEWNAIIKLWPLPHTERNRIHARRSLARSLSPFVFAYVFMNSKWVDSTDFLSRNTCAMIGQ